MDDVVLEARGWRLEKKGEGDLRAAYYAASQQRAGVRVSRVMVVGLVTPAVPSNTHIAISSPRTLCIRHKECGTHRVFRGAIAETVCGIIGPGMMLIEELTEFERVRHPPR